MSTGLYDAYNQTVELTSEQQACLKYAGNRTLMVKGYAGAGKSLVLMAIATKYLEKYGKHQKNKIAIFTFQNTLVSSTKDILKLNGDNEDGIVVCTVNSYISKVYDELAASNKAPRVRYLTIPQDKKKLRGIVQQVLYKHQTVFGKHRFHDLSVDFWIDEFGWMKDMNIGENAEAAYLQYKRIGRGSQYRFKPTEYPIAFQLYKLYIEKLAETKQGDWADQPMFLVRNAHLIPDALKFDHILIDEAQDLSLAQMMALIQLYREGGDMIVAMDANQKIHGKYWTPKLLGIESTTKKLTKSMRTTKQIEALAETVRSKNDLKLDEDDRSLRAIPEREGPVPKLVHLENSAAERKYIVNLVKTYLDANPDMTIGIIAAKNKQLDLYSTWLASAGIQHEQIKKDSTFSMSKPGVKVTSAFSSKGLEFNVVIIPMFAEGYFPYSVAFEDEGEQELFLIKMRNLVYVSMTRAKNVLVITWWGPGGSRYIADMAPSLCEIEGTPFKIQPPPVAKVKRSENPKVPSVPTTKGVLEKTSQEKLVCESKESPLVVFLKEKGIEVSDKRLKGGSLWVVGGKELDDTLKETKKIYGALWLFNPKGGVATKFRPGWFTKCSK